MKININVTDKIKSAIKCINGNCRERNITVEDVEKAKTRLLEFLSNFPKNTWNGTTISNYCKKSKSYKYRMLYSFFKIEYKNNNIFLVDGYRAGAIMCPFGGSGFIISKSQKILDFEIRNIRSIIYI